MFMASRYTTELESVIEQRYRTACGDCPPENRSLRKRYNRTKTILIVDLFVVAKLRARWIYRFSIQLLTKLITYS